MSGLEAAAPPRVGVRVVWVWRLFLACVAASPLILELEARPAYAILDIENNGPVLRAGGFALRVTNAGIIGNAFLDKGLSFDPSFEIHPGSGSEALNHAEFWVGAIDSIGQARVSGGPTLEWRPPPDPGDRVRVVNNGTPGALRGVDDDGDGKVDEEILNGKDDDGDGEVDEDLGLFAQEMMAADYVDDRPESRYVVSDNGEVHEPLGLSVHQEAYAWSAPGYEGIAGLSFHITNHGISTLKNVRVGLFADLDSRQRDDTAGHLDDRIEYHTYSRTALDGSQGLTASGVCWDLGLAPCRPLVCTTTLSQKLPVLVDAVDPHLPAVAVVPLDHTTDPLALIPPVQSYARAPGKVSFLSSVFRRGIIPGEGGPPTFDRDRYDALAGKFPTANTEQPGDYIVLVSCGPFSTLDPGQSLDFDVALVATLDRDSIESVMGNAALLHHGFLINAIPDSVPSLYPDDWNNGISGRTGHEACVEAPPGVSFTWDPHCAEKFRDTFNFEEPPPSIPTLYTHGQCIWTDADCDACTGIAGKETRVHWLDPGELPVAPAARVIPGDHALRIAWDNRPEVLLKAGLTGYPGMRFAGYRVYKLADWRNRKSLVPPRENWALWGVFANEARNGERSLSSITDTTLDYVDIEYREKVYPVGRYVVTDADVLNGFDYAYVVTTVLARDVDVGRGFVRTDYFMSPFTPVFNQIIEPHATAQARSGAAWVVPNPFRASETWDRPPVLGDPLTRHLDFMGLPRALATIKIWTVAGDHVATIVHDGSGGDGEAAWDLVSRNGPEVESGIYLFTVDSSLGHQVGKFIVIR